MMKRFMRFSVVLCLLAFVMSMSFMFVPRIESHAADEGEYVFYYGFANLEGGGRKLVLSPTQTDDAKTKVEQTSSTNTVPWVDLSDAQNNDKETKEVVIEGEISPYYISFARMSELTTITNLEKLDTSNVTNMSHMFYECTKLASLDLSNFDTSNVTNMSHMFYGCTKLASLDLSNFDTSNVTNMSYMFNLCKNLSELDLSEFNTSSVTDMSYMFKECDGLTKLELSGEFNTSQVNTMEGMFYLCANLTELNVSNFDTSQVNTMEGMFYYCAKLTSLDLSGQFNTSNVTTMHAMFSGCANLAKLDLSEKFNTSNVTTMSTMFYGCKTLKTLDVSKFDTSNVTNMSSMFNGCSGLTTLDLSHFKTDNVKYMSSMFKGCEKLTGLDLSGFNTSEVTADGIKDIFSGCTGLTNLNVSKWKNNNITDMSKMFSGLTNLETLTMTEFKTPSVTNISSMFKDCAKLEGLDLSSFDTSNVTDISNMFKGCTELKTLDVSGWSNNNIKDMSNMFSGLTNLKTLTMENFKTDNVTNMSSMFKNCTSLTELDLSSFDTSKVNYNSTTNCINEIFSGCTGLKKLNVSNWRNDNIKNMSNMFSGLSSLDEINLTGFKTDSVTNMSSMFKGCSNLTDLDLSGFDTSKVTNMSSMFNGCESLTELDVSSFNTSNVTNMSSMFNGCESLTELDVSSFNTSKVTNMSSMFNGCESLTELDVSSFNTSKVTNMSSMFNDCKSLEELDLSSFEININNNTGIANMFNGTDSITKVTLPKISNGIKLALPAGAYWDKNTRKIINSSEVKAELLESNHELILHNEHKCEYHEAVAPTCTEDGTKAYYKCTICGAWFNSAAPVNDKGELPNDNVSDKLEGIPVDRALGHDFEHYDAVDPTCNEDGLPAHDYCKRCKNYFIDNYEVPYEIISAPATGHAWSAWQSSGDDMHVRTCENCKEEQSVKHEWADDGKIDIPPTHLADGEDIYVCSVCSETKIVVLPKTEEHSFGEWYMHDDDSHKRVCACGESESEKHTWSVKSEKEATCQEAGEKVYICNTCGATKTEVIPIKTDHTYGAELERPVTCEIDGYTYHICIVCGHTERIEIFKAEGHKASEWLTASEADCVTNGIRYQECTVCGKLLKTEVIEAKGHSFGELMERPVTCEIAGYTYHTCDVCGHTERVEDFEATGHIESGWIIDAEADCVTAGSRHKECETCGKIIEKDVIKAKGHTYGELLERPVTCEIAGYTYHTCDVCGHTERVEDFEATGHTESDWIIDAEADCVTKGSRHKECKTCGKLLEKDVIEAKGHTFGELLERPVTCEIDGYTYHTCNVCGHTEKVEEFEATGHTFGDWVNANEKQHKRICTCGVVEYADHDWDDWKIHDDESREHVCIVCGEVGLSIHTWDEGEVITPATHTKDGKIMYTCQLCGTPKMDVIPKTTEHTFGAWEEIDENQHKRVCECGEEEIQEHAWSNWHINDDESRERECALCGREEFSLHTWDEGVVTKEPTCNDTGVKVYTCTICGTSKTEILPITDVHTYGAAITIDATCETAGYTYHVCDVCKFTEKIDDIKATGHKVSEWIIDFEADCMMSGHKHKECENCGKILETEVIEAKGHTYGELMTRPVTCEIDGYTYHSCTVCGHTERVEDFKATGHTFGAWVKANDKQHKRICKCGVVEYADHDWGAWKIHDDESREHVCSVCGEIGLSIHTWDDGEIITAATHLTEGEIKYTCQICGTPKTEVIPKTTEHTFGDWEDIDETQHKRICECGEEEIQEHAWSKWHINDDESRERECVLCGREELSIHTWGEGEVTKEPNCNDTGLKIYTCSICGTTKTEILPITNEHTYGNLMTRPVTCEEAGYTYHSCTVCGHTERVEDFKAIGHKESEWIIDAEADCVTKGSRHKECTICGKLLKTEAIEAKGHTFGELMLRPATCEVAGYTYHSCTVCGHTEKVEDFEAAGHTFGDWEKHDAAQHRRVCACGKVEYEDHAWDDGTIITAATHLTEGEIDHTCTVCGTLKREVIPKTTEHTFGAWEKYNETQYKRTCECGEVEYEDHAWDDGEIITAATHLTEGEIKYTCKSCGTSKTEVIPKTTEHTFGDWEAIDDAQHKHTCECGEEEYQDHAWDDGEIITAAAHSTDGEIKYTCTICGASKTEVITNTIEHTFGDWENIDETQHKHTCECGEEEYQNHVWIDGEIITAATHMTEGEIKYICPMCGASKTEIIPKTTEHTFGAWEKYNETQYKRTCECGVVEYEDHAWDDGEIITAATHMTEGEIKYTCKSCGTSKTEVIPKITEHTFGDWEDIDETQHRRTCECGEVEYQNHAWSKWHIHDNDSRERECVLCGREEVSIHTWNNDGNGVITKAPTCNATGEKVYTCIICGTTKTEILSVTNEHTYGSLMERPVTCEMAGYTYHSCTVCGHTEKVEDFEATGHTESDWIIDAEADSVTTGSRHKECTVCGKVLVIESTNKHFASEEEICNKALEDHKQKTGTTPARSEATKNADGTLSIVLTDENGNVLDTYVIDPVTGIGTRSDGNEVNLSQAGDHSFGDWEKHDEVQHKRTCECGEVEYEDHSWDDGKIITAATHLTEGEIKYTCSVCGTSKTEVMPKTTEHTFGEWEKYNETQYKRTCECGEVEYDYHAWDDGEIITAATHLTEGEIKYTCKSCGTSKTEVIPKITEHTFGDWEKHNRMQHKRTCECGEVEYDYHALDDGEIITAATHLTEGEIKYTCQVCGTSKTEVIPKITEHTFGDWEKNNETQHKRTCECGEVEYDYHAWDDGEIITAATHLTEGGIKYTCRVCGTSKMEVIPKITEHTFGVWEKHNETQYKRTCECGEVEYDYHSWDDGEIITAATHSTEGEIKYTCQVCGTSKTEGIPKTTEHTFGDWEKHDEVQHKCICECGEVEYDYHSWDDGEIITAATHSTEGEIKYTCQVCGTSKTDGIPKTTEHTFGDWEKHDEVQHKRICECGEVEYDYHAWDDGEIITAATHMTEGEIKYTCSVCGTSKTEVIPKTPDHTFGAWEKHNETQYKRTCECGEVEYDDHAWDDGEIITAATHLTEGEIKYTCHGCGTSKTEVIPKITEHTFGDWEMHNRMQHKRICECGEVEYDYHALDDGEIITAATHLTEGEIQYTCNVCGTSKTEVIPKTTEHTFGDWENHNETQHKHTCECGEVEYDYHAWDDGEITTAATHLTEGEIKYICKVCGISRKEVIPKTPDHTFGAWEKYNETQYKRTCECGEVEYDYHAWDTKLFFPDVDVDGAVDAYDASMILRAYAALMTGNDTGLTDEQLDTCDADRDGVVDATDASLVLSYYSLTSTGRYKNTPEGWAEFMRDRVILINAKTDE